MKTILLLTILFSLQNFSYSQNPRVIIYDGKEYFKLPSDFNVGKAMFPGQYGQGYFDQFNLQDGDWLLMSSYEPVIHLPTLIGQIINSKPEGIWKTYSVNWDDTSSYVSAEFEFKNGIIEGIYRGYNNDRTLRSEYEMKNNVYHGESTHFFHNGNVSVNGRFEYGHKVGVWKFYNINGDLERIESYVESIPEEMKDVYSSHELFKETFYKENPQISGLVNLKPGYNGSWYNYRNGVTLFEKVYDNGLLVYVREYHDNGVIKAEGPCFGEPVEKEMSKLYNPNEENLKYYRTGTWKYYDKSGSLERVEEK